MSDDRRFELPHDLSPEEERAIIRALERYFAQESPHPHPWVLAGRIDATGFGALQARHHADAPWRRFGDVPFARRGVPPQAGRGDAGQMTASKTASAIGGRDAALEAFRAEGCSAPRSWGNGPGDAYGPHAHGFHKVLFCLAGSITFHLTGSDVELGPGDRLDIEPGTEHAATVGPNGCSCVEASR